VENGRSALIALHHRDPAEANRRWRGRGLVSLRLGADQYRPSVPTTDAPFAGNVERKMRNPLAHFRPARLFPDSHDEACGPVMFRNSDAEEFESRCGSNPICPRDRIRTPMCWSLSAERSGWSTPPRATTNPAWKRRSFSRDDRTVCVGADKSEHCREFKEMIFHFAHQSSNPTCPATQSVSNGGVLF
jgi:hypothetical protein